MRAYLRDIFAEAVDQDFLMKDPARKVEVPTQLRETGTTTLTWDQLRDALMELPIRDRILLELDMTLKTMETVYKGKSRLGERQKESHGDPYSKEPRRRLRALAYELP